MINVVIIDFSTQLNLKCDERHAEKISGNVGYNFRCEFAVT
jgi:hypothetical protein